MKNNSTMASTTAYSFLRPLKRGIAILLAAVYLLIAVGPLPGLAVQSRHHSPGSCTGDCERDGCSLESRLNHTCCCWKNKQQYSAPAEPATQSGLCCHTSLPASTVLAAAKETLSLVQEQSLDPLKTDPASSSAPVFKCGCPCGSDDQTAVFGNQTNEALISIFKVVILPPTARPFPLYPDTALNPLPTKPPVPPPESA